MYNGPRLPKQERSIEKKNVIILAGLKLFSEKGYHKTNTAEIAKEAKVSTGIVYSYFKDKKDIFMHSIELYFEQMYKPMILKLNSIDYPIDLRITINEIINIAIESHNISKSAHEEMMAMSHIDDDVNQWFYNLSNNMIKFWITFLDKLNIHPSNVQEKLHIAINLIENLCHEYVYHKQSTINYDKIQEETVNIIINLLKS